MANSNANEMKKWSILNILDPDLMAQVRLALVFGKLGDAAIIVTKYDVVYAFGNNQTECLGIEINTSPFVPVEVKELSGKSVIKLVNGHWFDSVTPQILALTERGEIYSWGHGYHYKTPQKLKCDLSDKKVIDIACSARYAMALTDQGEVYFWGGLKNSLLNVHDTLLCLKTLKIPLENDKIVSITNTWDSISVLTESGVMYRSGCLTKSGIRNIRQVEELIDMVKLVSGYDHTLALSKEGFLYLWGKNHFGQCGDGRQTAMCSIYEVPSQLMGPIVDIAAGRHNSAALNNQGQVYMWGLCCKLKILIPTPVHLSSIYDVVSHFSLPHCGMRQSQEFGQERETNLSECIQESFDDLKTSDLIITVQDKPIHVHKAILKLRSAHFKRMFTDEDWSETKQSIIDQTQYSYGVYKAFLKYLYTGNIDVSPEELFELKQLAYDYLDKDLEELCIKIELNNLEPLRIFPSNMNELKKWPTLDLLSVEFITQVRKAFVFGDSGNEAIIITDDDKVYGLGTNKNGCLGIGITTGTVDAIEIELLSGMDVIKLAIGDINDPHVLALTRTGKIYSWGYNNCGQLGLESTLNGWAPVQIKHYLYNKTVVDIACGGYQSLALTHDGMVYQWGDGSTNYCTTPAYLPNHVRIRSIACMSSLNLAVTESREMYFWGQLVNPKTQTIESDRFNNPVLAICPIELCIEKLVASVSHLLVLCREGSVYVWSKNSHGESGQGNISDYWNWHKIPMWMTGGPIADIAAGPYINVAVNYRREVFMWGLCMGHNVLIPIRTGFSKMSDVLQNFCTPRGTHQLLELPKEVETNVLDFIEQGFDDLTTSDLVIMAHDKPIHVHKIILQLRSSYCERMFEKVWAGRNPIIIQDQHSYEAYRLFFKYLYTDRVDEAPENLFGLLELAIQVSDNRLVDYCAQSIVTNQRYKLRNFITLNHLIHNNQR